MTNYKKNLVNPPKGKRHMRRAYYKGDFDLGKFDIVFYLKIDTNTGKSWLVHDEDIMYPYQEVVKEDRENWIITKCSNYKEGLEYKNAKKYKKAV